MAVFETVALIWAALSATTRMPCVRTTVVFQSFALVEAGSSPLNALVVASSGSPSTASTMLKRRFCVFQPTVLKARVTAMEVSPEVADVSMRASIPEVDFASMTSAAAAM